MFYAFQVLLAVSFIRLQVEEVKEAGLDLFYPNPS